MHSVGQQKHPKIKFTNTTSSSLPQNVSYNGSWVYQLCQNLPFYYCIFLVQFIRRNINFKTLPLSTLNHYFYFTTHFNSYETMCIVSDKNYMFIIHHHFFCTSYFFVLMVTFETHSHFIYGKGDTKNSNQWKHKFHQYKKRLPPPI